MCSLQYITNKFTNNDKGISRNPNASNTRSNPWVKASKQGFSRNPNTSNTSSKPVKLEVASSGVQQTESDIKQNMAQLHKKWLEKRIRKLALKVLDKQRTKEINQLRNSKKMCTSNNVIHNKVPIISFTFRRKYDKRPRSNVYDSEFDYSDSYDVDQDPSNQELQEQEYAKQARLDSLFCHQINSTLFQITTVKSSEE